MSFGHKAAAWPQQTTGSGRTLPVEEWVIQPAPPGFVPRLREFWRQRRLIRFFGARALQKMYARTVLGWAWVIIRPLFPIVASTLVFGSLLRVQSEEVPYVLFFMVGMMTWSLFASSLTWATRSLELNRRFLKRLYFPHLILPAAMTAPALVELLVYAVVIAVTLGYFAVVHGKLYVQLGPQLLAAPAALLGTFALALAVSFFTSVWGASARDVRFTLAYVLDFWYFLTPVIYPLSSIPGPWRWLASINPMAALVETFKWAVLGVGSPSLSALAIAGLAVGVCFVLGLRYFLRTEADSVDNL